MLTRKIKEVLSRAHMVWGEKPLSAYEAFEEVHGPEKERYVHCNKTELAKRVIEYAVKRHMTDECVQFSFDPGPLEHRGEPRAYLLEGVLKAGLVVMSPKDFNELRRLVEDLSGSRPLNSPKGE